MGGKDMASVHLKAHVDKDGILKLRTLVQGILDQDVEVTLVIQPQPSDRRVQGIPEARGWPLGFFEETAGSIPDFPEIDYEGDFEEREPP